MGPSAKKKFREICKIELFAKICTAKISPYTVCILHSIGTVVGCAEIAKLESVRLKIRRPLV